MAKKLTQNHIQSPYQTKTINGLKVFVYPMSEVKAVFSEIIFHAGSLYEADSWGGFHLLEHLCHKGTADLPTYEDINNYKEEHSLSSNAYTGTKTVGFQVRSPYYSVSQALYLLSQLVYHPTFPQASLAKENDVISQEYKGKWDSPFRRFGHSLDTWIYGPSHPYLKDGIGQPEYVKTLKIKDIQKLHQDYFFNQNALLVVVGKVDPKEVFNEIQKLFKFESSMAIADVTVPEPKASFGLNYFFDDTKQETVSLNWPLPGRQHLTLPELYSLSICSYILGRAPNNLLINELRYKKGLVYQASANLSILPQYSSFEVYCSVDQKNTDQSLKIMKETVYDFLENFHDEERFQRAKKYQISQEIMSYDSVGSISSSLISDYLNYDRIISSDEYVQIIEGLKLKDVISLAKKYFTPKKEIIGIMRHWDTAPVSENFKA